MDHCFEASNRWKGRRRKLESTFVVKYCRRELAAVPPQEGGRHAGTDVETVRVHVRGRRPSRVEVAERCAQHRVRRKRTTEPAKIYEERRV